jgi:hypothetical protein
MDDNVVRLKPKSAPIALEDLEAIADDLSSALGLHVSAIRHGSDGGAILSLSCDSLEQLDDICRRLMLGQ